MGILSNLFKGSDAVKTMIDSENNQKVELLNQNFTLIGNVYRNRDNSIPDLNQFLKLNLSVDDYVFYVHGESQKDLQNRLAFKNNTKRVNKKRLMEKRLQLKSQKSKNKSKRIDGLQNDFYAFGMFAPFGLYHAANTFGLHTLNQFNHAAGDMMGNVLVGLGELDPTVTMISDTYAGGVNTSTMDEMNRLDF
jgi:hypothetical protein